MKAVLFCAVLATVAATPAFAEDLVARQGDDSVRLSDNACKSDLVLSRIEPGLAKDFRSASAVFQGQRFQACWRMMGNAAYLVYEDGDQGIIPANELKPDLTA
jgi:opacity protein-like surface antigen